MDNLLQLFEEFIETNNWQLPMHKSLIAVSGGMDSMALSFIFKSLKLPFEIAHCNFKLRAEASNKDAEFVKEIAESWQIKYHIKSFDTEQVSKDSKLSIQETARSLRYEWFHQISKEQQFDYIITAHHLNDSIETVLYNFTKGCGIDGLTGIPVQNSKTIRPLLFASRDKIKEFVEQNNIPFREDSSNAETKYARNKIRHLVVPVLNALNPGFDQTAGTNLRRLNDTAIIFHEAIALKKDLFCSFENDVFKIDLGLLLKEKAVATVLYEFIKEWGFNSSQIDQILETTKGHSGKMFFSNSHMLEIARDHILVTEKKEDQGLKEILIAEIPCKINLEDSELILEECHVENIVFTNEHNIGILNSADLVFPLKVRKWKPGDQFQPLGMNGQHQSLQDFFTHQKLARIEKEKVWILESAGEIVWVINYRISEKYKITKQTKKAVRITFES